MGGSSVLGGDGGSFPAHAPRKKKLGGYSTSVRFAYLTLL